MDELIPDPTLTPKLTGAEYAGFWRRFNAYGIDATIVWLIAMLVGYLVLGDASAQTPDDMQQLQDAIAAAQTGQVSPALMAQLKESFFSGLFGGSILGADTKVMVVVSAFYNIFFVTSDLMATPGKHWLKCKVVMLDGSRLTLQQSALRHAASAILPLTYGIACMTVMWTREKLAPYDMLCGTRVVMRTHVN